MPITIRDDEFDRRIRDAAKRHGISKTAMVKLLASKQLEFEERSAPAPDRREHRRRTTTD